MPRPLALAAALATALAAAAGPAPARAADDFEFRHENVMGTAMELVVRADDAAAAGPAEAAVLAEIDRLSRVFSGYDPASEFRRWQAAPRGPRRVSAELFEVLAACDRWRGFSGGAFDPRAEALSRLWSRAEARGRAPTADELAAARALLAQPAWRLDPAARTAERLSDCPLSLNAIAKGYVLEKACDAALDPARGVRGLLLNVGGDLRVGGDAPRRVGVVNPANDSETAEPLTVVEVRERAVATSGNSQRGFTIEGRRVSHILDPRTGLPAAGVACASVIADRSADADALATAFNVLTPAESLRLADALPGVACLIVTADGRVVRSARWAAHDRGPLPALAAADAPRANAADAGPAPWGDAYELAVTFEINRPPAEGGPYRRPYVAVWVENKDGFPVRNVALWVSQTGAGPFQWVPDLRRWYRADKVRKKTDKREMVLTIARPTRPPGKYTVVWDGKDDDGKPVPPGEYTVAIDAAREHGTYQGLRKTVTVGGGPFAEDLPGNVEIRSASLAYRKKTAPARD